MLSIVIKREKVKTPSEIVVHYAYWGLGSNPITGMLSKL